MDNAGGPSRADQLDLMLTYEQHAHARTKAERDAAVARAEQAERERDHYKGIVERDGGQEVLWLLTRDATLAALDAARAEARNALHLMAAWGCRDVLAHEEETCALCRAEHALEESRAEVERLADAEARSAGHHLARIKELQAEVAQARAECHALSGALDASIEDYNRMKRSYEAKVEDFARETLRVSALSAENTTLRAERDEARLEVKNAYNLFPPLLHAIDVALNGPAPDGVMRGYSTLPRQVEALRAALAAAQELLELPETCVVCSAILEPREDEAPHCYDCVVTDEHEAERQDRITQLEIALAQAAPAQEGQ